jgi:uncharacterized SAM-binding protein YcdF (DUF218 family)
VFIYLSKIVPKFFFPVCLCLELAVFAWVLLRRRPRLSRALLSLSVLSLWLPSTPALSDGLMRRLEGHYPVLAAASMGPAEAAVILGGGTSGKGPEQPEVELGSSGGRLLYGFRLYRAGRAPLLILSGGSLYPGESEAGQMRQILAEWGVPTKALLLEERSRNTHENAVEVLRLSQERGLRRILLVTSAFHMPRALAIFRHEAAGRGIEVVPAPTGQYAVRGHVFLLGDFLPDAGALANSTLALREYLGIAIYRLRGWL